MNWDAIGAIAELIGAIAVLITLVFLTLQLRYSNYISQHFYRKIGYGEDAALSFGKRLVFDSSESKPPGGSGTEALSSETNLNLAI